ncbi:2-hydroxyacid dehydrogenase [Alkalicoccus chagannorensis]|uniref:2-hydroxyacid dehydrogenase n=1 Tax=Alkalicoccus chagannorensis TaxID=427072 RepID=UPI00041C42A3|nr:D-glycerate dehydrogenase [Alkalicoccus chagannorensis]
MNKPVVYITRTLPEAQLQTLADHAEIRMWKEADIPVPEEVLAAEAAEADGLLTMMSDPVTDELLEKAPKLKVIANMAVGYDNIDMKAADRHGVYVCHTPDVLSDTTADLGWTLLLASARQVTSAADYVKAGRWTGWGPFMFAGQQVHQATIGIIGMGSIGTAVARRARGFDMTIYYHNRSRNAAAEEETGAVWMEKNDLLENVDFVVLTAPLTEETKGMIDAEALERMKPTAHLINIARGPLVDEAALENALREKKIAGAGLDVFSNEPIGADHPLLQLENVTALPHIGSAAVPTRQTMIELAGLNIKDVLQGTQPRTAVPEHREKPPRS